MTSVAEWIEAGVETLDLPSGRTIKVRWESPAAVARTGGISQAVWAQVARVLARSESGWEVRDDADPAEVADAMASVRVAEVCACLVDPVVTSQEWPQLPRGDRVAVLDWYDEKAADQSSAIEPVAGGEGD